MGLLPCILTTGIGATLVVDAWALVRARVLGVPPPDYGRVGRWVAHMRHGRFVHASIASASPVRGERAIGWSVHYLIGIGFAALLVALAGPSWCRAPTFLPALLVGVGTVLAPFLLMQPGMGLGVFARRAPRPALARLHSVLTHAIFGVGLYLAGAAGHLVF